MLKLEGHIREVHSMFHDLALWVAEQVMISFVLLTFAQFDCLQGELIDRIEYNVETASDYVQEGADDMSDAEKYHKQATRVKFD